MELYEEITQNFIKSLNITLDPTKIVELECYKALSDIKNILNDENLDDKACFDKIEQIVNIFEQIGSNGGTRHDF